MLTTTALRGSLHLSDPVVKHTRLSSVHCDQIPDFGEMSEASGFIRSRYWLECIRRGSLARMAFRTRICDVPLLQQTWIMLQRLQSLRIRASVRREARTFCTDIALDGRVCSLTRPGVCCVKERRGSKLSESFSHMSGYRGRGCRSTTLALAHQRSE